MSQSASRILIVVLFSTVIFGCTVKEERDGCPCRLFLDFTSVDLADQAPLLLSVFSDDGFEFSRMIDYGNYQDTCIIYVPRTDLNVVLWSGAEGYMDEYGLTIPSGAGCPPVYIHSQNLKAEGEFIYDVVSLKKSYCILNVSLVNSNSVEGMMVRGNVAGFDKVGNSRPGDFRVYSKVDPSSVEASIFYVPRLNGTSLYLDVIESDGMVKTFPLHDYVSAFEYDWDEYDLSDLNVLLNYTAAGVSVTIKVWDEEFVIDVVI